MRSTEEIVKRIDSVKSKDWMGTQRDDLVRYLDFDEARPFIKEDAKAEEWGKALPRDHESVKRQMLDYMGFAWVKANNNRGLSASRSIEHFQTWLWMLGEDAAADDLSDYEFYGKPQLRAICEQYGWDWRQWDNGRWTNSESEDGTTADAIGAADLSWRDTA